ncbi:hypothetical protein J4471_03500 [Candidatus Woesearchaeota archaeon]|nr:hypothetical protein [Candidatus Woesearchaeota archaeon]
MPIDKYIDKIEGVRTSHKTRLQDPTYYDNGLYLLLPETSEHSDILVGQTRLVYTSNKEPTMKSLNINPQNNDNRDPLYQDGYLGNINNQQALELNNYQWGFTLNPILFVEFLNILKSGNALNENNKKVDPRRIEAILDDILEARDPSRAEWLNSRYEIKKENKKIYYMKFIKGSLLAVEEELDKDTLMEDKQINLDDWLRNPTSQGLPRKNAKTGEFNYWYPRNGVVAGFGASSGRAYLDCFGILRTRIPASGYVVQT